VNVLDADLHGRVGQLTIDVTLRTGSRPTVLIGPNGAGKTSALKMILGALPLERGHVTLGPSRLSDPAQGLGIAIERRQIGYVPQRPALFPHLDVLANVAYGIPVRDRAERVGLARTALAELGLSDLAARHPGKLSGGEAQRVSLARALASCPQALLLDEPLAALDATVRPSVRRFLSEALTSRAIPTIVVTHDRADAEAFAGDVVVIEGGAVVQRGTLDALAAHPHSPFVSQFLDRRLSTP
jgi:molybdate transport system ATP-binding protein